MQNIQFPFNQKQHIFDFKVKVNFQNGNVSLTAPQIVTPPTFFNNQPGSNHNVQQNRNSNFNAQSKMNANIMNTGMQLQQNNIPTTYMQPMPSKTPQQLFTYPPHHTLTPPPSFARGQQIQLVNSSYTSVKETQNMNQSLTNNNNNNSMQMIECVLCQKSFNSTELQHHLQLHRNRVNNNNNTHKNNNINNISTQKGNVSNYAMTQNSVNGHNDDDSSILSDQDIKNETMSFQNKSYQSQNNSFNNQSFNQQKSNNKCLSFVTSNSKLNQVNGVNKRNGVQRNQNGQNVISQQQQLQQLNNLQNSQQNDSSFQLLGRIQNPILAIKAQQQGSLNHSYSSHPNQSLNYSNSDGQQSTTRFNNPMVSNQNEQIPQFHNPQSNNSSFGNVPGNNVIGPSFYQNSSHQSGNTHSQQPNGPVFKGINRLAFNEANGLMQSQNSMIKNPIPMMQGNSSFHSNHSNSLSYGSQHSNQFITQQHQQAMNFNNNSVYQQQKLSPHQSNSYSNLTNPIQSNHSSSFGSNGSLMNGNFLPLSNSNPIFHQNFQTIQSRYVNQPGSSSRQLYGSYHEVNAIQQQQQFKNNRNMMRNEEVPFSESDISSISYESRADLSQYSDWTDLKPLSQQKLQHGYNSADNSIIKNMQHHSSSSRNLQRNNNNNIDHLNEQNFFKKKKQYMISSAASYYDKKFKDEGSSSSDEEDNVYKLGRLSYAERLKEKRLTDNIRSMEISQAKSVNKLKQSHRSNKSNNNSNNNLSKCSDDSNMSKTKLPVNYLAREQFISTSSTSKSTHKTAVPN